MALTQNNVENLESVSLLMFSDIVSMDIILFYPKVNEFFMNRLNVLKFISNACFDTDSKKDYLYFQKIPAYGNG